MKLSLSPNSIENKREDRRRRREAMSNFTGIRFRYITGIRNSIGVLLCHFDYITRIRFRLCLETRYILATASKPQSGVDPSSSNEAEKPKIEPLRLPTMEEIQGQDIRNNCDVHSAFSGVMGGRLGLFMGLLLGALDNPLHQEEMTARQQFVHAAKQMGRSISSAKTYAVMGFIFSAAECVVEKARAKHDVTNKVVAGCATGGRLSARGGPKAACMGCAGFATFLVLIEKFLDRHD